LQYWEKSIEFTHTQTICPESLLLDEIGRSPGLRLVVYLPKFEKLSGFVDNNKLFSLQLREQLWF
jgi:hypothetical protein